MTAPNGLAGSPRTADAPGKSPTGESQRPTIEAVVRRCPTCRQHFSGDARFCPFDGDPLEIADGYQPDADPLIGKLIEGRYEVESVLGEGGMGSVYSVRHVALDKRFAMKVMRADLARQGELAARFIQEARATAAIEHPNIVQITDYGQLPTGAPYFVMELLEGTALSKLIRTGGPLPARLAVRILTQIASALAAAHAAGIIHRDLKPDNIHVAKNETVKILDFGVAKMAGAGRLTRTGMVFGTPHYMSPEQASGTNVDHRADMYALGIIMYEMFTGKVPFEADSYMGVLTKHMFMDPEPPSHVHEAARELGALEDVTMKCLEKKPEDRYASMQDLVGEIETIAQFSGDKLLIVRPSTHLKAPFSRPSPPPGLADQLEMPSRSELRDSVRAAGVPSGLPRAALVVVFVGAAAIVAAAAYVVAGRSVVSVSTNALAPAPPSALPAAALAPASALAPGLTSAPAPPSAVAPALASAVAPAPSELGARAADVASAPSPDKPPAVAAVPSKPKRPQAKSSAAAPRPAPASRTPTSPHTGFGSGEIVNPWAP